MNLIKNALRTIVNEPAVVLGVVVAAINTAEHKTWQGYGLAIGVGLLRFFVYGPLTGTAKP